jgi:hypothetical protein
MSDEIITPNITPNDRMKGQAGRSRDQEPTATTASLDKCTIAVWHSLVRDFGSVQIRRSMSNSPDVTRK